MNKEIGSEFWYTEVKENVNTECFDNTLFFMAGRTALDCIIKDIIKNQTVKKAYLPSFCCDSMIKPFLQNNIEVGFYDVLIDTKGGIRCSIDELHKCDIVLIMNYFGFVQKDIYEKAWHMHKHGVIVIEDLTHSLFSKLPENRNVDYTFASLRKWTMLYSGGFAYKMQGVFCEELNKRKRNTAFISLRKKAVKLKNQYINGVITDKRYLGIFSLAEQELDKDYSNYFMDNQSLRLFKKLEVECIRNRRRENGMRLLTGLKELNMLTPVFYDVPDEDTPMFIPILVEENHRDQLKHFLAERNIYCPVHWPLTELHAVSEYAKKIYCSVLSVICDQRYGIEEMDYILKCIREFGG